MTERATGVLAEAQLPNGATARVVSGDAVSPELRDRMAELLEASFERGWPGFAIPGSAAEHLQWKLEGPLRGAPSFATLVEAEGRLVSMALATQEPVLVRGRQLTFEGGGDACTHPDFEGRGMFSQRREFEQGNIEQFLDGSLSNSGNRIILARRARRGEGMPKGTEPRVYLRVFNARRLAEDRRRAGSRLPWPLLAVALAPARLLAAVRRLTRRSVTATWEITQVSRFDGRFDELFADAAPGFEFIKVRSSDYLNWRYGDRRGGDYRCFAAEDGGRLLGYVAIKVQAERGYLMDLLVRPGRQDVLRSLLARAVRGFREANAAAAMCWLPHAHPYRPDLQRYGFIDSRQSSGVNLKTYPGEHWGALDFIAEGKATLHLMLGDSDRA